MLPLDDRIGLCQSRTHWTRPMCDLFPPSLLGPGSAPTAHESSRTSNMLITAATVVTGEQILRPGWVEVVGERVARVGSGEPPTPPDVALGEVTIVPGFVDMHVHGGGGGAFPTGDPDDARRAIEMHRRHGTTSTVASLV